MKKQQEGWQEGLEKKNLDIFSEVSQALKHLKADLNKDKKENLNKFKAVNEEI